MILQHSLSLLFFSLIHCLTKYLLLHFKFTQLSVPFLYYSEYIHLPLSSQRPVLTQCHMLHWFFSRYFFFCWVCFIPGCWNTFRKIQIYWRLFHHVILFPFLLSSSRTNCAFYLHLTPTSLGRKGNSLQRHFKSSNIFLQIYFKTGWIASSSLFFQGMQIENREVKDLSGF